MTIPAGTRLGPYEIVALLGAGGMGEVYRARDPKLQRDVAIKVLPESFSSDPGRVRRFEKEARAASALNHPNIVTIHSVGETDGKAWLAMELVGGWSLREILFAGPLPSRRLLRIARQLAEGLACAHEAGIVHRDLKPENVMVTDEGLVKILDFGLAKTAAEPDEGSLASTQTGTSPGTILGTIGYMSPEQVRGLPADARSDIFSQGAILYELRTGRRAFHGDSTADTISAILNEEPPELAAGGGDFREEPFGRIVQRCLEKNPKDRFQSARDLAFALADAESGNRARRPSRARLLLVAATAVVGIGVAVVAVRAHRSESSALATMTVKRVAVLPFENLGAPEDDYFADGIADAVRGKLTALSGVEVIARASSITYKKTTKTPSVIAHELDAPYLLTATVRWQKAGDGGRVEVTPELMEVKETGAPAAKWQKPFDSTLTDVFRVQSEIATQVARELGVALGAPEEKRLGEMPTHSLPAYDAFLKGEAVWNSASGGSILRKALAYYEQAVALDPGFAEAWAKLSGVASLTYRSFTPTPDLAERARHAAEAALSLAPNRADGYLALGQYREYVLDDDIGAQQQFARAVRLGPKNADYFETKAAIEGRRGHWDAVLENRKRAEQLDPRSAYRMDALGEALIFERRYREAREELDRGLSLAP
ncbi:MAG TPA: serine/threonine-protein kinase, partial [Candidatus Eisenbacteria bacterium]